MTTQEKITMGVLVLNQSYEPLQICNVRRAMLLVLKEKASVIEHVKDLKIYTVNREFDVPSIIRVEKYIRIKRFYIKLTKENIFKRDKYICQYCGATGVPLTVDHVVPRVKGGKDTWTNLVTACERCNNLKGHRDLKDTNLKLINKPKKPHRLHSLQGKMRPDRQEWKSYLYLE